MSLTLIAYPLDDSNTEVAYTVDTMGDADIAITFSIDDINFYRDWETDRKSTRLNSSHLKLSRMPSSA